MKKKRSFKSLKKAVWDALSVSVRQGASDHRGFANCYTCGVTDHWKALQAGHAIPGRHGAVLFDLDIIRPQCFRCNIAFDGMHHIFATNLIKEHGLQWWDQKLIDSHRSVKFSRDELNEMLTRFRGES